MFLLGDFKKMISVCYRSHLFSCPLWSIGIIVVYIFVHVCLKIRKGSAMRIIEFILHVSEERFCRCIIYAVSFSRHRLNTSQFTEQTWKAWMCIMEALIRMRDSSDKFTMTIFGYERCIGVFYYCEFKSHGEKVCESFTRDHIFDNREVYPSIFKTNIGDICSKSCIRNSFFFWYTLKVPLENIWYDSMFLCFLPYLFIWVSSSYL
jgi:hypothetical protein